MESCLYRLDRRLGKKPSKRAVFGVNVSNHQDFLLVALEAGTIQTSFVELLET